MQFRYFMPTKVYMGVDCIRENGDEFCQNGKRALLVTGRNSARVSGALADVTDVLTNKGIAYQVFDQIEENPTLAAVEAGGQIARAFQPEMIIAIGGGSPLDAAKAIAVLAVNDISARQLYDGSFAVTPLPILAVPLTAGTGSEVTPYSILTDDERQTKRSFAHPDIFPKAAFLDARYTESLSRTVTVNSAVDALSHAIEGYLSKRSTPVSDSLALEAIKAFGSAKQELLSGSLTLKERETLLYVSLLGGIVIAQTATTVVHALGYSLTYFHNVPHGRANGVLLGAYLTFNQTAAADKIDAVLTALGLQSVAEFNELMNQLLTNDETYTEAEVDNFAEIASRAANTANTPRQPDMEDLKQLLRKSLRISD